MQFEPIDWQKEYSLYKDVIIEKGFFAHIDLNNTMRIRKYFYFDIDLGEEFPDHILTTPKIKESEKIEDDAFERYGLRIHIPCNLGEITLEQKHKLIITVELSISNSSDKIPVNIGLRIHPNMRGWIVESYYKGFQTEKPTPQDILDHLNSLESEYEEYLPKLKNEMIPNMIKEMKEEWADLDEKYRIFTERVPFYNHLIDTIEEFMKKEDAEKTPFRNVIRDRIQNTN